MLGVLVSKFHGRVGRLPHLQLHLLLTKLNIYVLLLMIEVVFSWFIVESSKCCVVNLE